MCKTVFWRDTWVRTVCSMTIGTRLADGGSHWPAKGWNLRTPLLALTHGRAKDLARRAVREAVASMSPPSVLEKNLSAFWTKNATWASRGSRSSRRFLPAFRPELRSRRDHVLIARSKIRCPKTFGGRGLTRRVPIRKSSARCSTTYRMITSETGKTMTTFLAAISLFLEQK